MTFLEFCVLMRSHLKKVIVIPVVAGALSLAVAFAISAINPNFSAKATVVCSGGDFTAVTGLANSVASGQYNASVSTSASTTNKTITVKATGSSADSCVSAANQAVNDLSREISDKQLASSTTVSEARQAQRTGKSPLFYGLAGFAAALLCVVSFCVLVDKTKGSVHSSAAAAKSGLKYLGTLDGNPAHHNLVVANLRFSGNDEGLFAEKVLFVPSNSLVHVEKARDLLIGLAESDTLQICVAPALDCGVSALYEGRDADAVVAVVESEVSSQMEINELIHEFEIAGITLAGYVYLPYNFGKVEHC